MYTIGGQLYHHGILGMKWGKKNGPPYPLGSGDHSASEKKAGWRKSLKKENKPVETTNAKKVEAKRRAVVSAKSKLASAKVNKKEAQREWNKSYSELENAVINWSGGDSVREKASRNAKDSGRADDIYKELKKEYKEAKKEYKKELNKRNENYLEKQSKFDRIITNDAGKDMVNRLLNTHEGMTVKQARRTTYITAGINTVTLLLGYYGYKKLTGF